MNAEAKVIIVTCARGAAPFLQQEIERLSYAGEPITDNAVSLRGTLDDALRLNLHLRTGHRVLLLLDGFQARTADDLYKHVSAFPWEQFLHEDGYLTITSNVDNPTINDPRFASLRCKDAIVDRLAEKTGRRPNSGPDRTGVVVHLHWIDDTAQVFIDTSGEPLSKRGYRKIATRAPMRESLAAACVLAAEYDGSQPFVNPMCGGGTIAIEAALIASGRAPGLLRSNFGFMHIKEFREDRWKALKKEALAAVRQEIAHKIIATDISAKAVEAATTNARAAGVENLIEFSVCDFRETHTPPSPAIIMFNPEYGERMGDVKQLEVVYRGIGDFLKQKCTGYKGYIFTGNLTLARALGLRSSRRIILYSGQLECRLLEFELYHGTRDP